MSGQFDPKLRSKEVFGGKYQPITEKEWAGAPTKLATEKPTNFEVAGRETKAVKQAMLASNNFATGNSTLKHYEESLNSNPQVIDLVVGGLPEQTEASDLKRISGSKHVITAAVEEDNFRGVCTGNGRI